MYLYILRLFYFNFELYINIFYKKVFYLKTKNGLVKNNLNMYFKLNRYLYIK